MVLRIVESQREMGTDFAKLTKRFCVYIRAFWIWGEGGLEIPQNLRQFTVRRLTFRAFI